MPTTKLIHQNPDAPAEALAKEAEDFLAQHPELQFMVELLTMLRELKLPWWTPTQRRKAYNATQRMRDVADKWIRQRVTIELTGALTKAALKMTSDLAAANIDLALEEDKSDEDFENAFKPHELVLYGDAPLFYAQFRQALPWKEGTEVHRELVARLIDLLLKQRAAPDRSETKDLQPVLTHHKVLSAISRTVWQKRIKPEVLEAVDQLLLEKETENPNGPFPYARYVMSVATSDIITRDIDLNDLIGIFEAAEKAMGFEQLEPLDELVEAEPAAVPTPDPCEGQDPKG
ncbi:MAG: hypothetical protein RDU25_00950 [Patescibacteria group bacterium]|nr:hypothetical protein [Patescibacteria group bacterium]